MLWCGTAAIVRGAARVLVTESAKGGETVPEQETGRREGGHVDSNVSQTIMQQCEQQAFFQSITVSQHDQYHYPETKASNLRVICDKKDHSVAV